MTDLDGVTRIDFSNNVASLIHGHAHPDIVLAVSEQIARGTAFAAATEVEVAFAEHMVARSPGFERIRFVNSGSEAVLCCIKAARAFTGRPKIAKVEGAYHGVYDFAEISQTAAPPGWGSPKRPSSVAVCRGTPASVLEDVVVIPFGDPGCATSVLEEHAGSIACVLMDPMPHRVGMTPASDMYAEALHGWARRDGALLVFDEVITYRSEYGGAQAWYTIKPDLTAMGKVIGGGFPVGAIAGRADVMDVFNPLRTPVPFPHSGTFSGNPVTLTAGLTAMRLFDRKAVDRVNALGELARRRIAEAVAEAGVPARVSGKGSLFRIHLKPFEPSDYREAYLTPVEAEAVRALVDYALDHGVMLINSCSGSISTPMTEVEIETLAAVIGEGVRSIRPLLETGCSRRDSG